MKRTEVLKIVEDSPASMFTKDDVFSLISKLDTLEDERDNIIEGLRDSLGDELGAMFISDVFEETVEKSSASFSLEWDKIILDEVEIDTAKAKTKLMSKIMDIVNTVVVDLTLHAGGKSCDGECGSCQTPCNEIEEEVNNPINQNNNE